MTQTKKTQLEIKVLSINTINEYALKCIEHELKFYSQFIGLDIFKVDGSIKQKYLHEKISFEGKLKDGTYFNNVLIWSYYELFIIYLFIPFFVPVLIQ